MKNTQKNVNVSVQSTAHNRGLCENLYSELYHLKDRLYYSSLHFNSLCRSTKETRDDYYYPYHEFYLLLHDFEDMLNVIIEKNFGDNLPF